MTAGLTAWTAAALQEVRCTHKSKCLQGYCPAALLQVTTTGGAAVITMERSQATGLVQHANGTVWNVTKEYKSGFFSSWNKVGGGGGGWGGG